MPGRARVKDWMTRAEVAAYLGLSERQVDRLRQPSRPGGGDAPLPTYGPAGAGTNSRLLRFRGDDVKALQAKRSTLTRAGSGK